MIKKLLGYSGGVLLLFSSVAFGQMGMEIERGVSPISVGINYKNNTSKNKENNTYLFLHSNLEKIKDLFVDEEYGELQINSKLEFLKLNKENYSGGNMNVYYMDNNSIYGINFSGYSKNSLYVNLLYQLEEKNIGSFVIAPYYSKFNKKNIGGFYAQLSGNVYEDDTYSIDYKLGVNSYKNFKKAKDHKKDKVVDSNVEISFSQKPYFDEINVKTEQKITYYHSFKDKNMEKNNIGISIGISCDIKNINVYAKDEYITGKNHNNIVSVGFNYRI